MNQLQRELEFIGISIIYEFMRLASWSEPRRVLGDFLPLFLARRFFSSARRNSLFILRMRNLVSIRVTRWRTWSSYKSENLVFNKTKKFRKSPRPGLTLFGGWWVLNSLSIFLYWFNHFCVGKVNPPQFNFLVNLLSTCSRVELCLKAPRFWTPFG